MNDLGLYGGYWLAARGCGDALSIFCILCRCFTPVQKKINCYSLDPYQWACLNQNDLNLSCPGKINLSMVCLRDAAVFLK